MERHAAVAFADLAGFTALTDVHGDHDALAVVDRLSVLSTQSALPGVWVVKTIGDAVMLASRDAADLVSSALSLIRRVGDEPRFPLVGIGIHAGPVLERDGDLFGHTVNLAARVASYAGAGKVLGTEPIAGAARATACASARALGPVALRNLVEPVELFELAGCDGEVPWVRGSVDPVCRMALDSRTVVERRVHAGATWVFCSVECTARFDADPTRYAVTDLGRSR